MEPERKLERPLTRPEHLSSDGTWLSHRKNGFRLDHAFASPEAAARVTSCRYSHREREAGLSDHSAVIVEIE